MIKINNIIRSYARKKSIIIIAIVLCLCLIAYARHWHKNRLLPFAIDHLEKLTGSTVHIESISLGPTGKVKIKNLIIGPGAAAEYDNTLLKAETAEVRLSLASLLKFNPRLKMLRLDDFIITAQYDTDLNRWNLPKSSLWFDGKNKLSEIQLHKGLVKLSQISNTGITDLVKFGGISARFSTRAKGDIYHFSIDPWDRAQIKPAGITGSFGPGGLEFAGRIPAADFALFGNKCDIGPIDLNAFFDVNNIVLKNFDVKLGPETTIALAGEIENYSTEPAFRIHCDINDLMISTEPENNALVYNERSFTAMLPALQRLLNNFDPQGLIDINIEFAGTYSNLAQTKCNGFINCEDVSIFYNRFPYKVEHIAGKIDVTENSMSMESLNGRHGPVHVQIDGFSTGFDENRNCNIHLSSPDLIGDDDLYKALSPDYKKLWSAFSPSGIAAVDFYFIAKPNQPKRTELSIDLIEVAAVYRHFPYPLSNITGQLFFEDGSCTLGNVTAPCGAGSLTINGSVTDIHSYNPIYNITLKGLDIPLDDSFAATLAEKQKAFYSHLKMDASADFEMQILNLKTSGPDSPPGYIADVQIRAKTIKHDQFDVTVEDVSIDATLGSDLIEVKNASVLWGQGKIPIRNITGNIIITPETVKFQGINATVASDIQMVDQPCSIVFDSDVILGETGLKEAKCILKGSNFIFDETLAVALGPQFEQLYANLEPTGQFDFYYPIVNVSIGEDDEKYIELTGQTVFRNCSFGKDRAVENFNATVSGEALYKSSLGIDSAKLSLDAESLEIRGRGLTNFDADIDYQSETHTVAVDHLAASCFGGNLTGCGKIYDFLAENSANYEIQLGFDDIDAQRFILLDGGQLNYTNGKLSGNLMVKGLLGSDSSRIGRLKMYIEGMKAGKYGLVNKLQSELNKTARANYSFKNLKLDSYFKGQNLEVEKLDLYGNFAAVRGTGQINLPEKNLDLHFTAYGNTGKDNPDFVESLARGLTPMLAKMDITGNFDNPKITTTSLPVFKDSLRIIGTKP